MKRTRFCLVFILFSHGISCVLKRDFHPDDKNLEIIGLGITNVNNHVLQKLFPKRLLENNKEVLHFDKFNNISSLTYLNMSNNQLHSLPFNLFAPIPNLLELYLTNTKLNRLDLGVFDPLGKLQVLDLSENNFQGNNLNSRLFEKNKRISFISFAGNDMNGTTKDLLHSFEFLETLNLIDCSIGEVPEFATQPNLETMKTLLLSSNQIKRLDNEKAFVNIRNIETLKIAENDLEYIGENVLEPLKNLKSIDIKKNKLTYLPDSIFQNKPLLENIDLSHNMISKVTPETFLGSSVKILNLSFNRLTYLTENFCLVLRNSGASLMEFYYHQNPWQCGCLREILAEVDRLNVVRVNDEPGLMKPVCVTTRYTKCVRDNEINYIFEEMYDRIKSGSNVLWSAS